MHGMASQMCHESPAQIPLCLAPNPENPSRPTGGLTRREFLKRAGAALGAASTLAAPNSPAAKIGSDQSISLAIIFDPADPIANSTPAQWAIAELKEALGRRQITVGIFHRIADVSSGAPCVLAAGTEQRHAREILAASRVDLAQTAEALALVPGSAAGRSVLLACGHNSRGLVFALLELADRVTYAHQPLDGLTFKRHVTETAANRVRSNMRLFASDIEDKSWFYDRSFWRHYLSMLVASRFNRFSLALGLGYDFTSGIRDAYFHFAYPFLVTVPGYDVQVTGLAEDERERNLEMLRFISEETTVRGLNFQLGIWTHAYQWTNSPHANHTIEGLTPETHAPYCRDALRALLTACPAISGVTFRIHGESGVAEGSYVFWKTVFEGLTQCGRKVGLDMHAKGMDAEMVEVAVATGLPVTISPKFWAEHMGLPYHQAAIRPTEMPLRDRKDEGFFSKSSGSRSFLRYGYGDLLVEGRGYGLVHRIWPGTQRLLFWGDPMLAAGYGRAGSFCGSDGVELFEPLSFKGRKGSGLPGGRAAYADPALKTSYDFEKYSYGYRLWGRLLYNPNASPEVWQRQLSKDYGHASKSVEIAISKAGRILPLITTAHLPSAANNNYWPEIYTNMPIVDPKRNHPYGDTPSPKRFGTVSPLDPQLFSTVENFAEAVLSGKLDARYSPLQVADWLSELAEKANRALDKAQKQAGHKQEPGFRRMAVDTKIQINLGRFFAWKLKAGVLFSFYDRTADPRFLQKAIGAYRQARQFWSQLVDEAAGVYVADISFGVDQHLRGHWRDRLPAIDLDIADMESLLSRSPSSASDEMNASHKAQDTLMRAEYSKSKRTLFTAEHVPAHAFRRGQPLTVSLKFSKTADATQADLVRIFYRHTNQSEAFRTAEMVDKTGAFEAVIPTAYTDSPFPLQYYFELRDRNGDASLYPGLGPNLDQQPYYVVRATSV